MPVDAPPALPPHARSGTRLGRAVLGYVLAVIGVITLAPFAFAVPAGVTLTLWDGWFDATANVALFLPLGFLWALTRSATDAATGPATRRATLGRALLLGALASAAIELTQAFEPTRYPSPVDVATNAAGALLGAWLHARLAGRLAADSPIVGRLALELPVMGLVYVLVPLLTLAALTVGAAPPGAPTLGGLPLRSCGLVALALAGGTLIGTVRRRQLGPAGALSRPAAAGAAAAWFALGAVPALAGHAATLLAGTLAATAAAWLTGGPQPATPIERRFEHEALGRAAPFLGAYLALLPLADGSGAIAGPLDILRQVETLAAFTVLGYLLAEAWGRLELRYRHTAWRVALAAVAAAGLAAALRHGAALPAGALADVAAAVVAAAYGGWLYHLQRTHIRALVAARRAGAAAAAGRSTPRGTAHDGASRTAA